MSTPHTVTIQGRAGADGTVTLAFPTNGTVPAGSVWLVQRIAITVPDTEADPDPAFTVHVGTEVSNETRRDGTSQAVTNAADYVWPIPVPEGQQLFGRFFGAEEGDVCVMHVQYAPADRVVAS